LTDGLIEGGHEVEELAQGRVRAIFDPGEDDVDGRCLEHADKTVEAFQIPVGLVACAAIPGEDLGRLLLGRVDHREQPLDGRRVRVPAVGDPFCNPLIERLEGFTIGVELRREQGCR